MKIEFTITNNTVELLSNTDTGENTLIINGVVIPESSWTGSGYYTIDGISIKKIADTSGNIFCNKISGAEYELAAKSETSYVTSVNGQTGIVTLDADDIPYNSSQSVGNAINNRALKTNIAKVEPSDTAIYRHEVGTFFINKDGDMCRTTSLITVGSTIVVNSNCVVRDVGTELNQLNADLSDISGIITTGYDTDYFDGLALYYSVQGHVVTITGIVHAIATNPSYLGKRICTIPDLPAPYGEIVCFPTWCSTNGGISIVELQYQTLSLVDFPALGWGRFNGSYLK